MSLPGSFFARQRNKATSSFSCITLSLCLCLASVHREPRFWYQSCLNWTLRDNFNLDYERKGRVNQFSSAAQSCLILGNPMNHSTPGLPVHHQLPEFTQTHIHQVGDAIQPSHPLLSPSPPAPNPSQHQSLFQ